MTNILAKDRRNENTLKEKISRLESKVNAFLNKYPELKGLEYKVKVKIFRNVKFWLRQIFIDSATKNIENLEQRKSSLIENEYLPVKDKIEKIETELSIRDTLSN